MNYLTHLIRSKGAGNLLSRAALIYRRFGLTPQRSSKALERILEITSQHGCTPTFFITADLLDSHGAFIQEITKSGVNVGLHGHHHIDHSQLSCAVQTDEIRKGLKKFKSYGIPVSGFRAPFLRFNDETAKALADSGLLWSSHSVMVFPHNQYSSMIHDCASAGSLLKRFYRSERSDKKPSLPIWENGTLDIPVSFFDDELLIDRLDIHDVDRLTEVWLDMLAFSHREGELFNFLFHPERIDCVAEPLNRLLEKANSFDEIWLTSLDDIGRWWHERRTCSFEIKPGGCDTFHVTCRGSSNVSLAMHRPGGYVETVKKKSNGTFSVQSPWRPTIGLGPGFCDKGAACLVNDGFVVETNGNDAACSVVLDGMCTKDHRSLLKMIGEGRGPLVRFGRWPRGYRSALTISLDLDAISLWDFVRRAFYFLLTQTGS